MIESIHCVTLLVSFTLIAGPLYSWLVTMAPTSTVRCQQVVSKAYTCKEFHKELMPKYCTEMVSGVFMDSSEDNDLLSKCSNKITCVNEEEKTVLPQGNVQYSFVMECGDAGQHRSYSHDIYAVTNSEGPKEMFAVPWMIRMVL
jgi:hypothetical protein